MKLAIRKIDRAIKKLYQIDSNHSAENFILSKPLEGAKLMAASPTQQGALYILPEGDDLSLGIYLNPKIQKTLSGFKNWSKKDWTHTQFNSFTTAAEEVSHFHYLLFHLEYGRGVSHFELELQGEIDKFLLSYFSGVGNFEMLYKKLFIDYKWSENLTAEQSSRYKDAHTFAKRFIGKLKPLLDSKKAFPLLRSFYRQSQSDRISFLSS